MLDSSAMCIYDIVELAFIPCIISLSDILSKRLRETNWPTFFKNCSLLWSAADPEPQNPLGIIFLKTAWQKEDTSAVEVANSMTEEP